MVEQSESPASPFDLVATVDAPRPDLSAEIALHVQREPSDRVACRRVHGDHYRCNWWSRADAAGYDNPNMNGPTVTTHRIRRSAFLRVTKTPAGLTILEL